MDRVLKGLVAVAAVAVTATAGLYVYDYFRSHQLVALRAQCDAIMVPGFSERKGTPEDEAALKRCIETGVLTEKEIEERVVKEIERKASQP